MGHGDGAVGNGDGAIGQGDGAVGHGDDPPTDPPIYRPTEMGGGGTDQPHVSELHSLLFV